MKTSTNSRIMTGALSGAAGVLFAVSIAPAAMQDAGADNDHHIVSVAGEAGQQDGARYIYRVKTGDGNAKNGIFWFGNEIGAQEADTLTYFTQGGVKYGVSGDQDDVNFLGGAVKSDGQGGYRVLVQDQNDNAIYTWQPSMSGGQSIYGWAPNMPGGKYTYARTPLKTGEKGVGVWTPSKPGGHQDATADVFFGPETGSRSGITFFDEGGETSGDWVRFGPKQDGKGNVQLWSSSQDDDVRSESVEVHVVNDDVTVKINGKEIPADRIKRENGRIIILDDKGDEAKTLDVYFGGDADAFANFNGPEWQRFFNTGIQFSPFTQMSPGQAEAPKVMIGVHMDEPGAALRKHLRLDEGEGVLVIGVLKGLPAEQAGIGEYDVIVSIDGEAIGDGESLRSAIAAHDAGDAVECEVIQSGRKRTIEIEIEAYDTDRMAKAEVIGSVPNTAQDFLFAPGGNQPLGDFKFDGGQWLVAPNGENIMRFQVPRDLMFDQNLNAWRENLPEQWQGADQWRWLLDERQNVEKSDAGDHDTDDDDGGDQIDRLDARIAELERLLDRLIEQAKRGGDN